MTSTTATLTASALAVFAALSLPANAQQPAPPAVAAPGTPGASVSGLALAEQLKAATAKAADPAVAEVSVTDQYALHEVRRLKAGPAAVHPGWSEVHFILDGSATLVTGGKMVPGPSGGNTIEGGVSHLLKKGDVFIIPANTPHMYSQVDGSVTYFETRFITAPPAAAAK
jgi:mannose-6-phosphate isomerase-like protein (cupin superfamily)